MTTERCKGGLWITTMGRIVLDNHNCETFCEPYDFKIMSAEELKHGIKLTEFMKRLIENKFEPEETLETPEYKRIKKNIQRLRNLRD